jgi:hypothetical protein
VICSGNFFQGRAPGKVRDAPHFLKMFLERTVRTAWKGQWAVSDGLGERIVGLGKRQEKRDCSELQSL